VLFLGVQGGGAAVAAAVGKAKALTNALGYAYDLFLQMSSYQGLIDEVFGRFDGHISEMESIVQRVGATEWSDSEYGSEDPFYLPDTHSHFNTQELPPDLPPLSPMSPILAHEVRFSDDDTMIDDDLPGIRVIPLHLEFGYDSDATVELNWTPFNAQYYSDDDSDTSTVVGEYEEPWTTPT
jgi:hypothetical protein